MAAIGYDCSSEALNVTTFSILDVGKCDVPNTEPVKQHKYVQLLQLSEFNEASVFQCKIEIDRTIHHCGMNSHNSIVLNGRREYLLQIPSDSCRQLHQSGIMSIGNIQLTGFRTNSTESRSVVLAGSLSTDGTCSGTQYSDPYGTWDSVVVQALIRVTLQDYVASIQLATNQIILKSGLHCPVSDGTCLDNDGGNTFWSPTPTDNCHFSHYDVLYEGPAIRLSPKAGTQGPVIYTVTSQETTFALTRTTDFTLCGYLISKTEHPKLFIMETEKGATFQARARIPVNNLDLFTYINSKFVYVEKHIKTQMTQLYKDIITQKCALEQQVLKNAIALANIAPDEVAYSIMKEPGYMATTAGEVLHVVRCIPIEAQLRRTKTCYSELPVTHRNTSLFLTPKSRILTQHGTQRDCHELLATMYKIHGTWYKMLPRPTESTVPQVIQPLTKPTWRYVNPKDLAVSGIYTPEDLQTLRDHIMFPIEKPAMLNTIARGAMGQQIPTGSVKLYNLLDSDTLDQIALSTGQRIWSGFITFGSASAGMLAIYLIAKTTKLVIDTVIHGYALHTIYGWSIHLLGALWDSLTNLLLHLGNRAITEREPADPVERSPPTERPQHSHSEEDIHQPTVLYPHLARMFIDDPKPGHSRE